MGFVTPPNALLANEPAIRTAGGDNALQNNPCRTYWGCQNLGTNPLKIKLGNGASESVFHIVLKPGLANDDGLGGLVEDEDWTGPISIAGTSPRYVLTELTIAQSS